MPQTGTMTLVQEAERAEKIRNGLITFLQPCSSERDAVQQINKAVAELTLLSCALRDIDAFIEEDTGSGLDLIHTDLKRVHDSVTFTLADIWLSLGRLPRERTEIDYQDTWTEIVEQSWKNDKLRVHQVLETQRKKLDSLCRIMQTQAATPVLERSRAKLGDAQARKSTKTATTTTARPALTKSPILKARTNAPTVVRNSSQRDVKKPAVARQNSSTKKSQPQPQHIQVPKEMKQPKSYERERQPLSPDASVTSAGSTGTQQRIRPWGPSPPLSPAGTASNASQVSSVGPSLVANADHWAMQVFRNVPSTPFRWSAEETRYHETKGSMELEYPNENYEVVLKVVYAEGVRVLLFCRLADYRAKVVVHYRDRRGHNEYGCLPLADLSIERDGSVLRFCRTVSVNSIPWLTMKFATYERMILFASTFIAMRSQDSTLKGPATEVQDDLFEGEETQFAGKILDGEYKHKLRILVDDVTRSARLSSSVWQGPLDRTPVWTAFITDILGRSKWIRRAGERTVALAGLKLHTFMPRYQPSVSANGDVLIHFENNSDAEDLLNVIDRLGKGYL